MKQLMGLVIAAALGWSLFWVIESRALRAEVETWLDMRRAAGWQAEAQIAIRGYPSRLDLTLTDLYLRNAQGHSLRAPTFQRLGLTYQPGHHILTLPHGATLSNGTDTLDIAGQGLRASLVQTADGTWLRLNIEAETLSLTTQTQTYALAGLLTAIRQTEDSTYQLGASIDQIALSQQPLLPDQAKALHVQSTLTFDAPWTMDKALHNRPQPTGIDLRQAQYTADDITLSLAGKLDIDADGTPSGATTLRAVNWQAALARAKDTGQLPAGFADTLASGLGLVAGLSGRSDTLDLPLTFKDGQTRLGPIPLGPAPRLSLP